jgi:hypothetical protein
LRVVVIPNNSDLYQRDTILVSVPVGASVSHTVTVPYRLHRIHFVVREKPGNEVAFLPGQDPQAAGTRIANARVVLVEPTPRCSLRRSTRIPVPVVLQHQWLATLYERITDSQGRVDFAFKASAGESFTFRVDDTERRAIRDEGSGGELHRGQALAGEERATGTRSHRARHRHDRQRGRGRSQGALHDTGIIAETTTNAQGEYMYNVPREQLEFHRQAGLHGHGVRRGQGSYNAVRHHRYQTLDLRWGWRRP